MLLTSWLCNLRRRIERPVWQVPARRRPARALPVAAEVRMLKVEVLEARELLSGVLADTTPATTAVALEGTSTGNVVLATFTDATHPAEMFTTLNPPGSTYSITTGVSGRNVVGVYWPGPSSNHVRIGYLYNGSTYTNLDPPGTSVLGTGYEMGTTYATGVSGNNVVGWYLDSNFATHAFLYNGSTYTTLDPPGATSSQAEGISGNNVLVDHYVYNGSTFTHLNLPNDAVPAGISGSVVFGTAGNGDAVHGFLYDFSTSTYTTLDVPGRTDSMRITGVSGNNVVGYYTVIATNVQHAFLYNGSTFSNLDPPGATGTYTSRANAIDGGNIVGTYHDASGIHGFLYNGSTYTPIDEPGNSDTELNAIDGSNVVGDHYVSGIYPYGPVPQSFVYQSGFTPSVNWGGALIGAPAVSVQMVSQSPTGTTWEVIGNATYAATGNHTVAVTVGDNAGNSVQTSQTTIAVSSLDGEFAVLSPGSSTRTLASIAQNGGQLALTGTSTATAAFTSPTTLLVGASDAATYGNSTITFGATGTFARQVWTKLDLPVNFTNPAGAAVHVTQNGTSVTFVDKFGNTSPGAWISPTQLSGYGETATVGSGQLLWNDGTIWSENLVIAGAKNGVATTSISAVPSRVIVTDYTNGNGQTVHVIQTGTTNLVFVDNTGHMALGTYLNATQAFSNDYPSDTATFTGNKVVWQDGAVWTQTASPSATITVTDYTNPKGIPVHAVRNGTNMLVFVDGLGNTSLGTFFNATQAVANLYPGDVATFNASSINWQDGTVWTVTNNPPPLITVIDVNGAKSHVKLLTPSTLIGLDGPLQGLSGTRQDGKILWTTAASPSLTITDYINAANGKTAHVIQNGTNTAVFINENGVAVLGKLTSPPQTNPVTMIVPAWGNDVATFGYRQIQWSDGSVWNQTTVAAPQLVVSDFVNIGSGGIAHAITTTTNAVIFVNEAGAFALGIRTSPTQATVPAWSNDVATFSSGQIRWSDGSFWTQGTVNLWDNFDLNALNALFELGTGYP